MSESNPEKDRKHALLARADVKFGAAAKPNARWKEHTANTGLRDDPSTACSGDLQISAGVHMPEFNSNGSCAPAAQTDIEKGLTVIRALRDALK